MQINLNNYSPMRLRNREISAQSTVPVVMTGGISAVSLCAYLCAHLCAMTIRTTSSVLVHGWTALVCKARKVRKLLT